MTFFSKKISGFLFVFLCCLTTLAYAGSPQTPSSDKTVPIQIHGDAVEYFHEDQKAVGTGHVKIDYEGVLLEADKITVFMATKKALAEGNVVLTQKGSVFKGTRVEYDFGKKVGYVSEMDATLNPEYYGKAQRIEKVSDNEYRAVDSYVTTCCGDTPFYKIGAREIEIFPDDKIVIKNAIMYIKNVPVLFIPYYVQPLVDFDRLPVQLIPGKSSEWGAFLLSKWRYNLVNRPDLKVKGNVLLDYRDKKGFGGGVETFYQGDKIGRGAVRAYYADDQDPPQDIDSNRSRVQWRHQSKLTESTTLTTEINKLSDGSIIKDYFYREEFERDAFPDNYVSLITAKPEYTFSILERKQFDDYFSAVNRNPEVRFDTHTRPWMDTPFYLRQEFQFSNLEKQFINTEDRLDTVRFDTNHTVSYAGKVGAVSVTPRIGTRQTYYSRDLNGDREHIRGTVDPGVDVSTRFYKVYDTSIDAFGLDYNQIRHIFQPTASYNYRPTPTTSRTLLQQFDSLDALDKQNFVRFNFENKFQTKHHDEKGALYAREFARIIPFFDYDFQTGRLENIGYDAEVRPYSWLGIESDMIYDARLGRVQTANADIYFDQGPWKVSVGQRYVRDESSQTTAEVRLKLKDWEFKVYDRFEFEEGESKEFEATISKYWDCIITDFTYNHREGDTFYFAIRLKAFPSTPFGLSQTYNRPKSSQIDRESYRD